VRSEEGVVVGWMERKGSDVYEAEDKNVGKRSGEITSAGVANEIHQVAVHES